MCNHYNNDCFHFTSIEQGYKIFLNYEFFNIMSVTKSNQESFKKDVLESKSTVFVDFYADWCGPCKMTSPIIDELSNEMKDVAFVKINVDDNQDLAAEYSVFSIPTFLIFKNGKAVHQFVGAMGKEKFIEEIKKA